MKILLRLVLVVFILLIGLTAMGTVAGLFVPTFQGPQLIGQPWAYETLVFGVPATARLWAMLLVLVASVIVLALFLHWASGGWRRLDRHENDHRLDLVIAGTRPDAEAGADVEALARNLERTARRLEERMEALETILLDHASLRS